MKFAYLTRIEDKGARWLHMRDSCSALYMIEMQLSRLSPFLSLCAEISADSLIYLLPIAHMIITMLSPVKSGLWTFGFGIEKSFKGMSKSEFGVARDKFEIWF